MYLLIQNIKSAAQQTENHDILSSQKYILISSALFAKSMSLQTPSGSDIIAQLAEEKRTWPGWSTIESEPVGKLFPLQSCSLCGCLVCAKM